MLIVYLKNIYSSIFINLKEIIDLKKNEYLNITK